MDTPTLAALEFGPLKGLIAPHVRTPGGRRLLEALVPSVDADAIASRKELAREAIRYHHEGARLGPGPLEDPEPAIDRLGPLGAILDPLEILRLVAAVQAADSLRQDLSIVCEEFPVIWREASGIPDLRGLTRQIAGKIAADGRLEDSASEELGRLRRRVASLEASASAALQAILDESGRRGLLQDSYVTVRGGRFVIPVRAEAKSSVSGIVHGASSTGATLFVEPLETLELNNELVTLREAELAEVRRILEAWSDLLRARLAEIARACARLAEMDLLGAVAVFGVTAGATIAGDAGDGRLQLAEARHPVLEAGLRARQLSPVPLSIAMQTRGGVLVLSGPNAGGKTVALKTIGLFALMNQSGLPVPAREAILPVFSQVLADIGDHQSILESLSTFSARMVRVAGITRAISPPALVLLDEVGAGTDPEEAGALAVSIVEHFRARGAGIVVTTHHEALKVYAETAPGAANASMEIDERTMRPTFRLLAGIAGRSGGVDLAERVGLPVELIADARSRLSTGHREAREYISRLHETTESMQREQALLRQERERLVEERRALEATVETVIGDARRRWSEAIGAALRMIDERLEAFLGGIKDRAVALQLRAEARRDGATLREQLERTLAAAVPEPPASAPGAARAGQAAIVPGSRVRILAEAGKGETGSVESIDSKGRVRVIVRGKRMTLDMGDLAVIEAAPGAPAGGKSWTLPEGVRLKRGGGVEAGSEINLIGSRVEEALDRLDKFLDDAYLAGHRQVRIVHGHGTGRLRDAVRGMLRGHPHVESHAQADERAGGSGATVAVLKS
ncbi:MAG TPA: Smr/MutS family protein [Candidatus Polarisedimenticolia bacterium]|jgi:DNA mismatch repair protein MutS2